MIQSTLLCIFLFCCVNFCAANEDLENKQLLLDRADEIENKILQQYPIIHSVYFQQICEELSYAFGLKKLRSCRVIQAPFNNAYALANQTVYVTTSLLKKTRNSHQFAHILAHEIAHLKLNHHLILARKYSKPGFFFPKAKIKKLRKKHEKQANEWANKILLETQLDHLQIDFVHHRLSQSKTPVFDSEHPNLLNIKNKAENTEINDPDWLTFIQSL